MPQTILRLSNYSVQDHDESTSARQRSNPRGLPRTLQASIVVADHPITRTTHGWLRPDTRTCPALVLRDDVRGDYPAPFLRSTRQ